jgi:hypothetical protein
MSKNKSSLKLLSLPMKGKMMFFTGCVLLFTVFLAAAQPDWKLKQDKENIKVYTKNITNSALKAIRIVGNINASLSALTAVLLDINSTKEWVYATKSIAILKTISSSELIYYSELEIPWPVSNRDFIALLKVTQDEKTKAVSIDGFNKPAYLPSKKNVVRIQQSCSKWLITPTPNGQLKIEYVLQVDPGGSVPAWLINLFATKGPFETFKKLREQVRKPVYANRKLEFIRE